MTINSKHRLKDLFNDTTKLPTSKFHELIDALWDPKFLYDEKTLSEIDLTKKDPDSEDYDERYVFARNIVNKESSYIAGIGFGNTYNSDFAQVYGYGNTANSFAETIIGPYGLIAAGQSQDEWVATDRLLTIVNGTDKNNRHDAVNVYKSGYTTLFNALAIGEYDHGEEDPLIGTLQVLLDSDRLQLYTSADWKSLAFLSDLVNFPGFGTDHTHAAYGDHTHSGYALSNHTHADYAALLHTHSFLSLTDTFDIYPVNGYGPALIANAASVGYAGAFGQDALGAWVSIDSVTEEDVEHVSDVNFEVEGTGWTYGNGWLHEAVTALHTDGNGTLDTVINVAYARIYTMEISASAYDPCNLLIYVNGVLIQTLSYLNSEWKHTFQWTSNKIGDVTISIKVDVDDAGIRVHAFHVTSDIVTYSNGFRIVDSSHATIYKLPYEAGAKGSFMSIDANGQCFFAEMVDFLPDGILFDADFAANGLMKRTAEGEYTTVDAYLDHLLDVQSLTEGYIPTVVDTDGVKSIVWVALSMPATVLTDSDFAAAGIMATDGEGTYSIRTDVVVDGDFSANGILVRTGAGTYGSITNNSSLWNTLDTLGTKKFWNGTAAAYAAISPKDSNTIYFINA